MKLKSFYSNYILNHQLYYFEQFYLYFKIFPTFLPIK